MMHDAVMERVHAAGDSKQRSQKHDCHRLKQSIACREHNMYATPRPGS